jgi:hypothetical protein
VIFAAFRAIRHRIRVSRALRREKRKEKERSPEWPGVRDAFKKDHPNCSGCDSTEHLQVHHILPFHLYPTEELKTKNFIGLCMGPMECHLLLGHGGKFDCYNPLVVEHAASARRGNDRAKVEELARKYRRQ